MRLRALPDSRGKGLVDVAHGEMLGLRRDFVPRSKVFGIH
jgi:hypothetical protein